MALHLNKKAVKMGVALPVSNQKRKIAAAVRYFALKVEDETGNEENWLLLTDYTLYRRGTCIVSDVLSSALKKGRLYRCYYEDSGKESFILRMERPKKDNLDEYETVIVHISPKCLKQCVERAALNPEDIPEQGWFSDWRD